ncbi:MAG: hypothetical protein HGB26_05555 [Desulfobulbaceae bacterium]|nr:hypothetical protein [Desulfobulbaceae bacterium]
MTIIINPLHLIKEFRIGKRNSKDREKSNFAINSLVRNQRPKKMRKKPLTLSRLSCHYHAVNSSALSMCQPNHAVQPDAAGAALTWARFTRQTAPAYWQLDSAAILQRRIGTPGEKAIYRAAGAVCWRLPLPRPVPILTPASGAADSCALDSSRRQPS